ncbi:L-serine ammonia-lyase, iron-sulfur-dependent subunit beta [Vampirovibrio sp.]|uniref:L-serine ammonia-lyase, iron-sulfur-dependent subunit beta n=1 Tax=Vampirovibrio sp. TaxID=2717857 RepID=UPI0035939CE8
MNGGSLFDIVGPIMVGPSSSHTAGAVRLANLARMVASQPIQSVEFVLYNSFAQTYQGHGTDRGLIAGILGYGVNDERIRDAFTLAEAERLNYRITPFSGANNYSPNTVIFNMILQGGQPLSVVGHSIGGGKVYISKIDDHNVSIRGEMPTLILFYKDKPGMIWQVTKILAEQTINIATLTCNRNQRGVEAFMIITLDSLPPAEAVAEIRGIPDIYTVRSIDKLPA